MPLLSRHSWLERDYKINDAIEKCKIGQAEIVRKGKNTAILSFGTILSEALIAGDNTDATVVDMKWVKPLDTELIKEIASNYEKIVTIEDGSIAGGAGSAVNEELNRAGIVLRVINLGSQINLLIMQDKSNNMQFVV